MESLNEIVDGKNKKAYWKKKYAKVPHDTL